MRCCFLCESMFLVLRRLCGKERYTSQSDVSLALGMIKVSRNKGPRTDMYLPEASRFPPEIPPRDLHP